MRQVNRIRHRYLGAVLKQPIGYFDTDASTGARHKPQLAALLAAFHGGTRPLSNSWCPHPNADGAMRAPKTAH